MSAEDAETVYYLSRWYNCELWWACFFIWQHTANANELCTKALQRSRRL